MPRYYHGGPNAVDVEAIVKAQGVSDAHRTELRKQLTEQHPLTTPAREVLKVIDGKLKIKKPGSYCAQDINGNPLVEYVDWPGEGSIAFGLLGYGFYVVPPGGHVDLDPTIPEDTVKAYAPHLLTEAEAMARGLVKPAPEKAKPVLK